MGTLQQHFYVCVLSRKPTHKCSTLMDQIFNPFYKLTSVEWIWHFFEPTTLQLWSSFWVDWICVNFDFDLFSDWWLSGRRPWRASILLRPPTEQLPWRPTIVTVPWHGRLQTCVQVCQDYLVWIVRGAWRFQVKIFF